MSRAVQNEECYENILRGHRNPNEHQPTNADDSMHIKSFIKISLITLTCPERVKNTYSGKGEIELLSLLCNQSILISALE